MLKLWDGATGHACPSAKGTWGNPSPHSPGTGRREARPPHGIQKTAKAARDAAAHARDWVGLWEAQGTQAAQGTRAAQGLALELAGSRGGFEAQFPDLLSGPGPAVSRICGGRRVLAARGVPPSPPGTLGPSHSVLAGSRKVAAASW